MEIERIRELALANGFKLKEQPDGSMDLNPYVFDFANALLAEAALKWVPLAEELLNNLDSTDHHHPSATTKEPEDEPRKN